MAIRLHFWGADQTVTGSSHHIECAGQNVLLDCGLFQGRRQQAADINSHLALHAAAACRGRAERGRPLPRAHRPQRRPASAGEAGLSRAHLHHARHHRPLHAHAEGQRAHPGMRRRVHHARSRPAQGHRPASRPRARPAALHPGRRRAGLPAVPARQAA